MSTDALGLSDSLKELSTAIKELTLELKNQSQEKKQVTEISNKWFHDLYEAMIKSQERYYKILSERNERMERNFCR